jgi:eukaryotic-like serine/threonine-protein kinase
VQLTFGPTEEKGLAIAPDGRSLVTAVTSDERSVWVHQPSGERPISSEGFIGQPSFSNDGKKLFYLWRSTPLTRGIFAGELRSAQLDSGKTERLLPQVEMADYAVSPEATVVVFTAFDNDRKTRLWIAPLDHRSPPRQLTPLGASDESDPHFGPQGNLFFESSEGGAGYVFRMDRDGTRREKLRPEPVIRIIGLSPDGQYLVARVPIASGNATDATVAYPIRGGDPMRLCSPECYVQWSGDGKFFYITPTDSGGMKAQNTFALPLNRGEMFPGGLPASGIQSEADLATMPGSMKIPRASISLGLNPSIYAFVNTFHRSNLYRIPIDQE